MGLLAAVTSGFGLLGGLIDNGNKKTAKKVTAAAQEAADKNRALFESIYNQTRTDLAPYNQAGQAGLAALTTRLGLGGAPTAGAGVSNAPAGGGAQPAATPAAGAPNFQAYFDANPDLGRDPSLMGFNPGDLTGDGKVDNADRGAWHYQAYGQNEGRALPGAAPAQPAQPAQPPMTPQQEAAQFGTRPEDIAAPTYQRGADMAAPSSAAYFANFQADPGYQFRVNEALGGVNAMSAARGKLRSGDAAKALAGRASDLASQEYNNWFNRQMALYNADNSAYQFGQNRQDRNFLDDRSVGLNLWNQQQNRRDNIFSEDRGFNRSVYDQGTANLFNVVGIGQNAAAGTANAGNIFANSTAAQNNSVAQTQGNAALWRQGQLNNLFGSAMNLAGTFAGGGF